MFSVFFIFDIVAFHLYKLCMCFLYILHFSSHFDHMSLYLIKHEKQDYNYWTFLSISNISAYTNFFLDKEKLYLQELLQWVENWYHNRKNIFSMNFQVSLLGLTVQMYDFLFSWSSTYLSFLLNGRQFELYTLTGFCYTYLQGGLLFRCIVKLLESIG